jgi:hypothetical protein
MFQGHIWEKLRNINIQLFLPVPGDFEGDHMAVGKITIR